MIGALRINTLSKLTFSDSIRFQALINDVFPNAQVDEIDYSQLKDAIKKALHELKLEFMPKQVSKVLQLYASLRQRMGCVLVGPSGCGKSTLLNVLHSALGHMNQKIVRHVMNPKALERQALLGRMDQDTREFSDGVLIASARAVQRENADTHTWIICDGDIDPEWVESLNSVLDDNHLLTMPNGERIKFGSNVNFIFETHDLSYASPATISRMGMIFLSDEDCDLKSLVHAYCNRAALPHGTNIPPGSDTNAIATLQKQHREKLQQWCDEILFSQLEYIFAQNSQYDAVQRTRVGLVQTALSHLHNSTCRSEFVLNLLRGAGANLLLDARLSFAKQLFTATNTQIPSGISPLDLQWNRQNSRVS
jgi:dynein heavy chain 2, cytosolic